MSRKVPFNKTEGAIDENLRVGNGAFSPEPDKEPMEQQIYEIAEGTVIGTLELSIGTVKPHLAYRDKDGNIVGRETTQDQTQKSKTQKGMEHE